MKKITIAFLLFSVFAITSCEGPMGPQGLDGDSMIGTIFEMEGDFLPSNNNELFFDFPSNFEIFDTDVVLVYILWDVQDINGKQTDVWRLLPQTVILDEGFIQYNFDNSVEDVRVFLETTIPFNQLRPAETQDQVFRIAVLPADFIAKKSVDILDLNSLIKIQGINFNIVKNAEIEP